MKKLTTILRALKRLISEITEGKIGRDDAMNALQGASIKLADLIGHSGFTHPQCARCSAQLARVRQKVCENRTVIPSFLSYVYIFLRSVTY
jgi:hypothetical protein